MDTKEIHQLEALELKVAQAQKEVNALLLQAKEKRLQLENLKFHQNNGIAEIQKRKENEK
ncbi:hypothetical protein [Labilibaculum antarcticum]|uniref:Uncharacterized protein n=1 Tax=Labilibaculum antarcticum TaxID=1717717 RepID=A0A1Y1CQ72_9BACT|nr:hypothetical protein [Labilibaculum antarcticum]BAX82430.1 hypothetical protein ALGA_4139 [Labilibaculum antarcticum]